MDVLFRQFEQSSIFWLIVAGLVGALIKYLFDQYLAPALSQRLATARVLRRYANPLLQAAERLAGRLDSYLVWGEWRWYKASEDYFKLTMLYSLAVYLYWADRVDREAFLELSSNAGRAYRTRTHLYTVSKSMSSHYYLEPLSPPTGLATPSIPKFAQIAIGELVGGVDKEGKEGTVIGFSEFALRLGQSDDSSMTRWFGYVDNVFDAAEENGETALAARQRVVCIATMLSVLLSQLSRNKHARKPVGRYLDLAERSVRERLHSDIDKVTRRSAWQTFRK